MISVGFELTASWAGVAFRTFADAPELVPRMMSFARRGPLSLLLLGRIYYRSAEAESDAMLVLTVYERGGLTALEQLDGDFALAAYDATSRRVVALRSPLGAYPLFWTQRGDGFALSTSIRTLVERDAPLDDDFIADYLAYPMASLREMPSERTAYRGVHRLLPGGSLEADLGTGHVARRKAWDWAARVETTNASSMEEAAALVRDRLTGAVRERLGRNGATAAHFSGGMDSTAVALLAERLLADRGEQVEALTHVYRHDPILLQEREYIDHALRGRHALRWHPLDSDDFLRWDGASAVPPLDEPAAGVTFFHKAEALADLAREANADTILGGDGADQLFAHPPSILAAELLRRGHVLRALRLMREHAAASTGSAWTNFTATLQWILPARRPRRRAFGAMSALDVPAWFTRDYATSQRLADRTRTSTSALAGGRPFSVADMPAVAGNWLNWHIGAPRGILITLPFFDTRVISLVLGLPSRFHEPSHPMKPLLAAAMRGIVPDPILERSRKAHFGALVAGYARNCEWLERLVEEAPVDGMIDRDAIRDAIDRTALGLYGDALILGRLEITLAFVHWLAGRRAWMERAPRYCNCLNLPSMLP